MNKPNHKLKDYELFSLAAFLKAREKQLLDERPAKRVLAQYAADALKFEVTADNLRRALRAAGIKYEANHPKRPGQPGPWTGKLARHEAILAALCKKLGENMDELAAT